MPIISNKSEIDVKVLGRHRVSADKLELISMLTDMIIDGLAVGTVLLTLLSIIKCSDGGGREEDWSRHAWPAPGPSSIAQRSTLIATHAMREERQLGRLEQIKGDTYVHYAPPYIPTYLVLVLTSTLALAYQE